MKRHFPLLAILSIAIVPALGLAKDNSDAPKHLTWAQGGMNSAIEARIDSAVSSEIARGNLSGCVVLIGRREGIVFEHAYGDRQVKPSVEPMTIDTVFDMASLTKPLATATSIMILVERGQMRLSDKVTKFFPDFAANGKEDVTVEHLLTHSSGLIPDNPVKDYDDGWNSAEKHICDLKLLTPAGAKFKYSDVNFILLGKIVEKVSGKPEDEFVKDEIYSKLGMSESGYNPSEELRKRAETIEKRDGKGEWIKGQVHDPRAFALDGVAGHAGLFSTAEDLARYGQMMLGKGKRGDVRIMSEATWEEMIRPRDIDGSRRGLGWDSNTGYSRNRGDLMSDRAVGHGGFTGTSMWIDPELNLYVIFLGDRLHPDGKGEVNDLAGRIGSMACGALTDVPEHREVRQVRSLSKAPSLNSLTQKPAEKEPAAKDKKEEKAEKESPAPPKAEKPEPSAGDEEPKEEKDATEAASDKKITDKQGDQPQEEPKALGDVKGMKLGIDVLAADDFKILKKKKVGLITNQTGLDSAGVSTIDRLKNAPGVTLVSLFSPEHGIRGLLDQPDVKDTVDEKTGLPIYSLYGKRRWPTKLQLEDIDVLVFDVQDVGVRYYTNTATMALSMKAAAEAGKQFVVLDRPDPIDGVTLEGPMLDGVKESFVGIHNLPIRYGLTIGELAKMYAKERNLKVKLTVVPVEGWQRNSYLFDTGMIWTNPSPNMRSLRAAALYPGIGVFEYTNISVGRGTNTPFELVGAPWINERDLAYAVNEAKPTGVTVLPIKFTPTDSKFKGQECRGLSIMITDLKTFKPFEFGLTIMHELHKLYPRTWETQRLLKLLGNKKTYQQLVDGENVPAMLKTIEKDLDEFRARKKEFEIYK